MVTSAASAAQGKQEMEYESDLEDTLLPSMRRREASDDEDREGSDREQSLTRKDFRDGLGSDRESDVQGTAQVYDDDEVDDEEDEYYNVEEEEELGDEVEEGLEGEEEEEEEVVEDDGCQRRAVGQAESPVEVKQSHESEGDGLRSFGDTEKHQGKDQAEGDEKKENEPFAVPTAGAFYMHDDRFQENGRGRRRRMPGAQKLWDPKDEHAWVHDRFEEMNMQDVQYNEERQRSKGRFSARGGGKSRGAGRGYARVGRPRNYSDNGNNQSRSPRTFRGRGPTHYERVIRSDRENLSSQRKHLPGKPQETAPNPTSGRQSSQNTIAQSDTGLPQKHAFSSSLSYTSPPFYPSGSSSQDLLAQKRDIQTGNANKTHSYSVPLEDNSQALQSSSLLRGKTNDTVGHDKLSLADGLRSVRGKPLASSHLQPSGFSSLASNAVQSANSWAQGRGLSAVGQQSNQPASSFNQVGRVSTQVQSPVIQQRTVQSPIQSALQVSTQQLVQRPGSGNQGSSPPQPTSGLSEVGESDSPPGSSKSKASLVGKSKSNNQGTGRGSFMYGGAQVIGATGALGLAHGDQNFPGTPALLPVMQFGGQHPGGLGVSAVGMALPGYVAQPQLGFGNSEMTWVPVLAGAAGALGTSYCPPYLALDSSYYGHPTGLTSLSASSRETSESKPSSSSKSTQRPEIVNDELGQRQNKPRRYSEMNFGQ